MKTLYTVISFLILVSACNNEKDDATAPGNDTLTGKDSTVLPIDTTGKILNADEPVIDNTKTVSDEQEEIIHEKSINDDNPKTNIIGWTKLVSGSQSSMHDKSMLVITDKIKFDELWKIAFANDLAPQKPNVDFTKNSVVVLFLGEVTSGGHSIELASIKTSATGNTISVVHTKPGRGCMSTTVMEYPYFFALTDKLKTDKADFKTTIREKKCQ